MAVLSCSLCEQPVRMMICDEPWVFCCHGCRDLFQVLGEDQVQVLKSQPGVLWANVAVATAPPVRAEEALIQALDPRTAQYRVAGVWCPSCGILIEHAARRARGVLRVKVDFAQATVDVLYDGVLTSADDVRLVIERLGYRVNSHDEVVAPESDVDVMLHRRVAVSVALTGAIMMLSVPVWLNDLPAMPPPLRAVVAWSLLCLAAPVLFWSGWPFLRGAWSSLAARVPTMDLLVTMGGVAAFAYSLPGAMQEGSLLYFDTASLLVTFLLISRTIEAATQKRVQGLTAAVKRLVPLRARLYRDGNWSWVDVASLSPGDSVLLHDGEVMPVDGRVSAGRSQADESVLTGEARRVEKRECDAVYAGSTHHGAELLVQVARAQGTLVEQTVEYVRLAQAGQTGWQRLAARLLRVFVPTVLAVSGATVLFWTLIGGVSPLEAVWRAIAVLVIGCPCALGVATPLAVLCGAKRLSGLGVLLRSPDALERARRVDVVVFDKTGTLTTGTMSLYAWRAADGNENGGHGPPRWLQLAASAEFASPHPLAEALVRHVEGQGVTLHAARGFQAQPGWGVSAVVQGHMVAVGATCPGREASPTLEREVQAWRKRGLSTAYVAVGGAVRGAFCAADEVRPVARSVVRRLSASGVSWMVASGDHADAVRHVVERLTDGADGAAKADGVNGAWLARQTALDKVELIRRLQSRGNKVAFVGDGVNDAPALVAADLGIAMGSSADIALQAGHLVLAHNRLEVLPEAFAAARLTAQVIRQNIAWAVGYNLAAQAVAVIGVASPALAALAMLLSSVFVLGNALRVAGWSPWRYARRVLVGGVLAVLLGALAYYGV